MKSTFTNQCTLDHFIVRGNQISSFHNNAQNDSIQNNNNNDSISQNRTIMNEIIELLSDNDTDDDDDVIDVWYGGSSSFKNLDTTVVVSCKQKDHIQVHEKSIQEPSALLATTTTTTTSTTTTIATTKTITLTNQPIIDLNITDIKVPNRSQTSFVLDDSSRSEPKDNSRFEPNGANMDTKFHNEAMEKQGSKPIQQQQNLKENDDNVQQTNIRRPCRKRCTPQEAVELSDLRIRLELQSGYKPSMEEVEEQYQHLKKMEKKTKKLKSIDTRKKRCTSNNRQKNSHKTTHECTNNDISSKSPISSTRDNNSSPVKCGALNKINLVWENKYESLIEYINQRRYREGSSTVPWIWDGNVPDCFTTEDGIHLGKWIGRQRTRKHNGTLNPRREKLLIGIGLKWGFSRKLATSSKQQKHQEQHHKRNDSKWNLKTTTKHNTKDEYTSNDISSNIINSSTQDNNSSPVKCGVALKPKQISSWKNKYESLVEYVNQRRSREGSSTIPWIWDGNVPLHFITNDGIRLRKWINRQRVAKHDGTLNPEREQLLISIGLKWGCSRKLVTSSKQQEQQHERNDNKCNSKTTTKTNGSNQMDASDKNRTSSSKKHENVSKSKDKFEQERCMIYQESTSLENSTYSEIQQDHSDTKCNDSSSSNFLKKKSKKKMKQDSINNLKIIQHEELKSKKLFEHSEQLYIHGMLYIQRGKYYSASIAFGNSGNIIKLFILKYIRNPYKHEKIIISNNEHGRDDSLSIHHKNIAINDDHNDGPIIYNNLQYLMEKYAEIYYKKAMCCYNDKNYLQVITACNKILVTTNVDKVPRPLLSSSQPNQNTSITQMDCDEELPNDVLKMIPKSLQADALCQRAKANLLIKLRLWKTDDDDEDNDDDIDDAGTDEKESVDCCDNLSSLMVFQSIINHHNDCVNICQDMKAAASLGNNYAILWCDSMVQSIQCI